MCGRYWVKGLGIWSWNGSRKVCAREWGPLKYAWREYFSTAGCYVWAFVRSTRPRVHFLTLVGLHSKRTCASVQRWVFLFVKRHLFRLTLATTGSVWESHPWSTWIPGFLRVCRGLCVHAFCPSVSLCFTVPLIGFYRCTDGARSLIISLHFVLV